MRKGDNFKGNHTLEIHRFFFISENGKIPKYFEILNKKVWFQKKKDFNNMILKIWLKI